MLFISDFTKFPYDVIDFCLFIWNTLGASYQAFEFNSVLKSAVRMVKFVGFDRPAAFCWLLLCRFLLAFIPVSLQLSTILSIKIDVFSVVISYLQLHDRKNWLSN